VNFAREATHRKLPLLARRRSATCHYTVIAGVEVDCA
jgi:hypothetical protein